MTESEINTWETRFTQMVDTKARDVNTGVGEIPFCNNLCRYEILYPKSDQKDKYIKGIYVHAKDDVLHIDPTVHTERDGPITRTVENKNKNYITFNGAQGEGAEPVTYELIDIIIQSPSRALFNGTRYPMEVCLLHKAVDKDLYLVVCNFMTPDSNSSNDSLQETLKKTTIYNMFEMISEDFPSSGTSLGIKAAQDKQWSPRIFYPPPDKRSFFYWVDNWIDPKASGRVLYVVFPKAPAVIPDKFFNLFVNTLVTKGHTGYTRLLNASLPEEAPPMSMFYNKNEQTQPVQTEYKCEVVTDLDINKYLVNQEDIEDKVKKPEKKEENKEEKKSSESHSKIHWEDWGIPLILLLSSLIILGILWWKNMWPFGNDGVWPFGGGMNNSPGVVHSSIELDSMKTPLESVNQ